MIRRMDRAGSQGPPTPARLTAPAATLTAIAILRMLG